MLFADVAVAGAEGTPPIGGKWSQPAILSDCPGTGAPHVVFPSDSPTHGTGPGAIVWSVTAPCPAGAGVLVAPISAEDDLPGQPAAPRTADGRTIALRGSVAATGGPYGRVVIAAPRGEPAGGSSGASGREPVRSDRARRTGARRVHHALGRPAADRGPAGGPFAAPLALGGPGGARSRSPPPTSAMPRSPRSRTPAAGTSVQLRVQRHHADRFAAPAQVIGATGAARSSSDRSAHGRARLPLRRARRLLPRGSLYARELPGKGAPHALQRLGPSPPAGRADRGRPQRRRPRDRRLDRSPRRADERLCLPLPARRSLHASRSCSKNSPTLPACPTTSTRPGSCASPRRA